MAAVKDETPTAKSLMFYDKTAAKASPGQFVMVWIPGVDEIPMSLSSIKTKEGAVGITVEAVGEATISLQKMKVGGIIGVRGPFGNGYKVVKTGNVMIVGGGTGLVSLVPLAQEIAKHKGRSIAFLLGAKTHSELLFLERIETLLARMNNRIIATTEDGSYGMKCLVTEPAEQLLGKEKFDMIYACGPEMMMHKMFLLAERFKVPLQASLERFMRCSVGLCGTCVIGRYRVCKDGPVFSGDQLREVKDEFGHFRRGFDGKKIGL